jgi:hypothetical protein
MNNVLRNNRLGLLTLFFLLTVAVPVAHAQDSQKPWVRNSIEGVSFDTPTKMIKEPTAKPAGFEEQLTKYEMYLATEGDVATIFIYAESTFQGYDKQKGLSGAIGNMITAMTGTELKVQYTDPENAYDDLRGSGSFVLNGTSMQVDGYLYWNGKGKFLIVSAFGETTAKESTRRICESVTIEIP